MGISIEDIGGAFIVIFSGIMLALVTLGVEFWYFNNKTGQKSAKVGDSETMKVVEYDN